MTINKIQEMLKDKDYDFLRTDEHLKDRLIFVTLGGSHAYGTDIETSDVDIRGCALNSPSDLLGLSSFEQYTSSATDTTIYSFNKLIPLLLNCNPNVIEMLGCKPEHYLYMSDVGLTLLARRKMFLSVKAADAFGGYAVQQLRRLENALARDRLPEKRKEEHTLNSMNSALRAFNDRHKNVGKNDIRLFIDESPREDRETEIFADIDLKHYSAREFKSLLNELSNVVGTYDKLGHRNQKKDDAHLNKHAMHLIRLYLMCLDILEREEIVTYREKERDFLLSIRNGAFQNPDGTYRQDFFDMVSDYEKRLAYARKNTSLPRSPNMKQVEEFVMEVNRDAIQRT